MIELIKITDRDSADKDEIILQSISTDISPAVNYLKYLNIFPI